MVRTILNVSIVILSLISCSGQDCNDLPSAFASYEQAVSKIRSAHYVFTDVKQTPSSSWMKKAEFFSCDSSQGYFIYTTKKGKTYVHDLMPISVWEGFKEARSFGEFYHQNIKDKYLMAIK